MLHNIKNVGKLPLIILSMLLGLLILKKFFFNQDDDEHSIGKYSKAIMDNIGRYELGGTITGLQFGKTLVLVNNQERIYLSMNGEFFFKKRLGRKDTYDIRVERQPENQYCRIINRLSQNAVTMSDISTVRILCTNTNIVTSRDSENAEPANNKGNLKKRTP